MNDNPYSSPSPDAKPIPQPSFGDQRLATRWERFVGQFVDGVVVGAINFAIGLFLLGPLLVGTVGNTDLVMFNVALAVSSALVGTIVFFGIQGYLLATKGQTIGKLVVGTQIVSETDGKILPFVPLALKRYIPFFIIYNIPFVGGFVALINAVLIFRENHHCLHDDVANTRVIKL